MINEIVSMNGYGLYVWSAFIFTLLNFAFLYLIIKLQLLKEQKRFASKFSSINDKEKERIFKEENLNREILTRSFVSKI